MAFDTRPLNIQTRWKHYREPVLLAASGGAIDTISFIALFGLFTAHVTGNLVVAGATLAGNTEGILAKLLALPFFMLAVALTSLSIRSRKHITSGFLAALFFAEIILLLTFTFMGCLWTPFASASDPLLLLTGMVGVMAMGVRNATTRLLLSSTSPSTMMTGNVTQLTIDILDWLHQPGKENKDKLVKSGCSVLGFLCGAALGGLGYLAFGFVAMLLPVVMVLVILAMELQASPSGDGDRPA